MFIRLFWQQMIKAFSPIVALTLLFPTMLLAENAKFDPSLGTLHIPIVEVPNGDKVDCYRADFGIISPSDTLSFTLVSANSIDCDGVSMTFNEQQTRRLLGTWTFSYMINADSFSNTYTLIDVEEDSNNPGLFLILGMDKNGNAVTASFTPEEELFALLEEVGDPTRNVFAYDFTSENIVSGCHFDVNIETLESSECHPFTGTRTP